MARKEIKQVSVQERDRPSEIMHDPNGSEKSLGQIVYRLLDLIRADIEAKRSR
jgi:hypothetical protein